MNLSRRCPNWDAWTARTAFMNCKFNALALGTSMETALESSKIWSTFAIERTGGSVYAALVFFLARQPLATGVSTVAVLRGQLVTDWSQPEAVACGNAS